MSFDATCLNQNISFLLKSVNEEQVRQTRSLLLYTWSLPSWIWQIFELPAKHVPPQQLPTAVFPNDKIIYPLIVAVLIQLLHCPRNPLVCLCPRRLAGTPLHLHPMESWEADVSGDLCRVRCYWMREILTWNRVSPCVYGSVCDLWTPSAEFSVSGQSSPGRPLCNAGRNPGKTIL